jgi:hypothetical protein
MYERIPLLHHLCMVQANVTSKAYFLLVAAEGQCWLWRPRFEPSCMGKDNNVGWAVLYRRLQNSKARLGAPKRVKTYGNPRFSPTRLEKKTLSSRIDLTVSNALSEKL